MKSIKVLLHCPDSTLTSKQSEIDSTLMALGLSQGAEVSLTHTPSESLLVSADLVGFSREESSTIRAHLRSSLGGLLA